MDITITSDVIKRFNNTSRSNSAFTGCLLWDDAVNECGEGVFELNGVDILAADMAYTLAHGTIADDMRVLHTCGKPRCVEKTHLKLGTECEWMKHRAVRKTYAMQVLKDDAICKIFDIDMNELEAILYGEQGRRVRKNAICALYFNLHPEVQRANPWTDTEIAEAFDITLELVQHCVNEYIEQGKCQRDEELNRKARTRRVQGAYSSH